MYAYCFLSYISYMGSHSHCHCNWALHCSYCCNSLCQRSEEGKTLIIMVGRGITSYNITIGCRQYKLSCRGAVVNYKWLIYPFKGEKGSCYKLSILS